jgi:hypothetical protein
MAGLKCPQFADMSIIYKNGEATNQILDDGAPLYDNGRLRSR